MQSLTALADAAYLSKRPLPTAPDGHYDWQNQADPSSSPQNHAGVTNLLNTLKSIAPKGPVNLDPSFLKAFVDAALHPKSIDDRKGLFADGIALLSRIPPNSAASQKIADSAISLLYKTVPHPPATLMGPTHSFRGADGGGNNHLTPDLGRAGMPYARSVQGKWCIDPTSLPEPGLIFDTLMKSRDRKDHPGGNSSLTFAFASLVTHSLFRGDPKDGNVNATSSYLDLSLLYGHDQAMQDSVRNKSLGRGLLHPDTFSEDRFIFLPPASSALMVILSRNHNYIASMLLTINERGRWSDPPPTDEARKALQDEEIFQTARLVNCGHFISLIMNDYVAGFLGLSEGLESTLMRNAFGPIQTEDGIEIERGLGNHCSVEFNLLYRWHPTLSAADEKWTEDLFNNIFNNKPFDQLTIPDLGVGLRASFENLEPDPKLRTFGGLKRGPDGKFSDDDLAKILFDATESPAGAFGAQGTPSVMRVIEMMGILQARKWCVCTMNEFRQFLGLKQFNDFEDWNPDPEVAGAARRLYGHVDNLELYTGLQCEATMPLYPGVRFSCGYTVAFSPPSIETAPYIRQVMRAILGDAIALVRGDRFYTTDFTPGNLTVWGYQNCQRDPHNGGGGGELPKLLLRHLPGNYPFNSVYSCYPLFTPHKMKESLTAQGIAHKYTFERPVPARAPKILKTFTGIKHVFNDPARFITVYEDLKSVGEGYGFFLGFDNPAKHDPDRALAVHAFFPTENSVDEYRKWYRDSVAQKIKERSWKYDGVTGNHIDIVKSVINSTSVHWATDLLCGLPLKTKENPKGLFTEQEIYDMFGLLTYVLIHEFSRACSPVSLRISYLVISNSEHTFAMRSAAMDVADVIQELIKKSILEVAPQCAPSFVSGLISKATKYLWPPFDKPYYPFMSRLSETGRPVNELVGAVLSLAVGSCLNQAQATVHVIDFYLDDARKEERLKILKLVHSDDPESTELLRGYVREGMRLNPQFTSLFREATVDAVIPQGHGLPDVHVKAGDFVVGSFRNAHLNSVDFPNPTIVDPTRPVSSYHLNGTGFHVCAGVTYVVQVIADILKIVFKLKNVRRAPGNAGKLAKIKLMINEAETNIYLMPYGTTTPFPSSMHLVGSVDGVSPVVRIHPLAPSPTCTTPDISDLNAGAQGCGNKLKAHHLKLDERAEQMYTADAYDCVSASDTGQVRCLGCSAAALDLHEPGVGPIRHVTRVVWKVVPTPAIIAPANASQAILPGAAGFRLRVRAAHDFRLGHTAPACRAPRYAGAFAVRCANALPRSPPLCAPTLP
ncbi:heme peroxidase [Mycena crocata]|nr:heme peroxidase [Mycena crocata]